MLRPMPTWPPSFTEPPMLTRMSSPEPPLTLTFGVLLEALTRDHHHDVWAVPLLRRHRALEARHLRLPHVCQGGHGVVGLRVRCLDPVSPLTVSTAWREA